MATYTEIERAYLIGQNLGRLATVGPNGVPQVRPVGFRLNEDGTVDIGGPKLSTSQKWRNAERNPAVAFVVDDMTPDEPGPTGRAGVAASRSAAGPSCSATTNRPSPPTSSATRCCGSTPSE